ncbi:hypothetical protein RJ55_06657 [Drechmeria coniospora]|nr:hypothetical protein RJ55_06657 [Drechmeria coniospora]
MRLLLSSILAAQTAVASVLPAAQLTARQEASSARLLMSSSGNFFLADFANDKLSLLPKKPISGHASWVAVTKDAANDKTLLYALDENGTNTTIFSLDAKTGDLVKGTGKIGSNGVVHLEFNKDKTRMVGSSYGDGTMDVWKTENGGLELLKTVVSDSALGPNKTRQSSRHPHQAVLDPTGRFFAVNDLGTDSIVVLDSKDDSFAIVNTQLVPEPGCGPRHGSFFPVNSEKASHYMVVCEMTNKVHVFKVSYDSSTIKMQPVQAISTFQDGGKHEHAAAGELVVGPDNKSVYVSNRLDNSDGIAHFRINPGRCGKLLEFVGATATGGTKPRMFSFSSDGKHVFVGNQAGELGAVVLRRREDGTLEEKPVASIKASEFGEPEFGPSFVQQIA